MSEEARAIREEIDGKTYIHGTLSNGFEYKLESDVFDDWAIMKLIRKVDNEDDISAYVELVERLLGEEQLEALEKVCFDGRRVSLSAIREVISELFNQVAQLKN